MPIENQKTPRRARMIAKLIEMVHLQQLDTKTSKSVINFIIDEVIFIEKN